MKGLGQWRKLFDKIRTNEQMKEKFHKMLVIVDESHLVLTGQEKFQKQMDMFVNNTDYGYVLLLSATPFINEPEDILPQLKLINKDGGVTEKITKLSALKNTEILENNVLRFSGDSNPHIFYDHVVNAAKLKGEPTENYPGYELIFKYIQMSQEESKTVHDIMKKGNFLENLFNAKSSLEQSANSTKMKELMELMKPQQQKTQSIVYCEYKQFAQLIKTTYTQKYNGRIEVYNADANAKDRNKLVSDFNQGLIDFMIVSRAGSIGMDLKCTFSVIFASQAWNFALLNQFIGRAIRYNSHAGDNCKYKIVTCYCIIQIYNEKSEFRFQESPDLKMYNNGKNKETLIQDFLNFANQKGLFIDVKRQINVI